MSARSGRRHSATLALWTLLALGLSWCAHAGHALDFDIPRGPASQTLPQFQHRTGLQFIYDYESSRHIYTNAVQGRYDPAEALAIMTKGTPIRFEFENEDQVTVSVVMPAPPTRKTASADPPASGPLPSGDRRSVFWQIDTVTIRSPRQRATVEQLASRVVTLTRADIDAMSFATTEDVIRTLPQVFGGGPTEDTRDFRFEAKLNAGLGTGVNLRGLDAGSTLILLNGVRIAGSGSEGVFTDISSLPLSIIERIEILPDSASTLYGGDAVGGVVNFVLVDSFEGAQTEARFGTATRGELSHDHVSQLLGIQSRLFDGVLAFDFYSRDGLKAADRAQARSDLRAFGGDNFDVNFSNPATIVLGANSWAVPRGQDGTHLQISDLIPQQQNTQNRYLDADIMPEQQRWSLYASGKKAISDSLRLFGDALFSQRDVRNLGGHDRQRLVVPATNPFNPFGSPVPVNYDLSDDLGLFKSAIGIRTLNTVLGADLQAPANWRVRATADFAYEHLDALNENSFDPLALQQALADPDPATSLNVFGDGSHTNPLTLARIRGDTLFDTDSRVWSGNVTASREIPGLGGGTGKIMAGADFRRQSFDSQNRSPGGFQNISNTTGRTVRAGFLELSLPLVGKRTEGRHVDSLAASLAARYEDYSDFGHTVTPRLGLTWSPVDAIALRGTWSRSFRPPNLLDLDETNNFVTLFPVQNPAAQGASAFALVESGKNAHLREEHARSWTLGIDLEFPSVPHLSTALTYFNTRFTDRMNVPNATPALLSDPSAADIVTLNPTLQQRQAMCDSARFIGDPSLCMGMPVVALADLRVRNSALMLTNGIDLLGQYVRESRFGTTTFRLDGTYVLSFAEASTPESRLIEGVSTQHNPIDLRLRGAVDWQHGPFRTAALVNYFDDYRDIASTPHRRVGSWTTLDLNVSWSSAKNSGGPLAGTTISLSAENVFDKDPPFLNNQIGIGYDQENGDLLGRILSVTVRKNW